MDKQLLNYKKHDIEYLDGRYFNIALRDVPNVIQQPLVIRASPSEISIVGGLALFKVQGIQYMRLIIEFLENVQPVQSPQIQSQLSPRRVQTASSVQIPQIPQMSNMNRSSQAQSKVISRHSNLLIIDHIRKRIQRFEPLDNNAYDPFINSKLMKFLEPLYVGYTYNELSIHPQKDDKIGLCVAYVIKYAYFHYHEGSVSFEGNYDIYQFGKAVTKLYGVLDDRNKDIEFGYGYGYGYNPYGYNPYGGALGVGLLTAGAIGLASGLPALGAVGLIGGAALLSAPGFY